jgi:membrane-associated protease RseP (regulator of RpoE activity)
MPALPPDSSGSPPPSATRSSNESDQAALSAPAAVRPLAWRTNAWLFVATVGSVLYTQWDASEPRRVALLHASQFTGALLAILLAHEFGHYIAARLHKVDASLPFFIPLPILSPFGTMGAVIRMRSVIPTRRALFDIGAAGPLAGLTLAIPLYAWGAAHSNVQPLDVTGGGLQLGDSLLTRLLGYVFAPPIPPGSDLMLSPVAFAAWAGMFVTMINLLPVGQLDGGHVAFALFGPRQNRIAQWVHRSVLAFFFVSVASFCARDLHAGLGFGHLGRHVNSSLFWLVWFEVLAVLGSLSQPRRRPGEHDERDERGEGKSPLDLRTRAFAILGLAILAGLLQDKSSPAPWVAWFLGLGFLLAMEARWGALRPSSTVLDHPPTGAKPLGRGRAVLAIVTLAFFVLLFMPTPIGL